MYVTCVPLVPCVLSVGSCVPHVSCSACQLKQRTCIVVAFIVNITWGTLIDDFLKLAEIWKIGMAMCNFFLGLA